jgi:hypothetical protein
MLHAALDIDKHAFQAAVLDSETVEVAEKRFWADWECLARWAEEWRGRVEAVAVEATTGSRWVWRELAARERPVVAGRSALIVRNRACVC